MIITVKDLRKTYMTYKRGDKFLEVLKSLILPKKEIVQALKGISFSIEKGELLGLLGPNGAGKSTTIKIMTGVLYPASGEVSVMGYTPWKQRRKYVRNIGALFGQKSQLIWDIPPLDAFRLNQAIYDIPEQIFKKRLNEMTEMLSVKELITKPTRNLSLGERMKCEFIMAMLHRPEVVFLDEPTIGLDVIAKEKIREFILEMNRLGTTFILTTHDMDDVERLAKRVIVINFGEIVFDDSIGSLKKYLGTKKVIHLSTHNPLPELKKSGIEVKNNVSDYDVELELDISRVRLNDFIEEINKKSSIADMSIGELPIESIIKELYLHKR